MAGGLRERIYKGKKARDAKLPGPSSAWEWIKMWVRNCLRQQALVAEKGARLAIASLRFEYHAVGLHANV